jgi:hypothetical protein
MSTFLKPRKVLDLNPRRMDRRLLVIRTLSPDYLTGTNPKETRRPGRSR